MVYCGLHHTPHMRTALFLGAGASEFAGLPTTTGLMDGVRTRVKNTGKNVYNLDSVTEIIINQDHYKDIEKLYDGIDRMLRLRDDVSNIRPVFIVVEANSTLKNTINALRRVRLVIRDVLLNSFDIKSDTHNTIRQMYNMVRSVIGGGGPGEFLVFTTNYDTVLEKYCDMNNLVVVNGFRQEGHLRRVWADKWTTDAADYMHLIKLHGSIFWHEDSDGDIVETGTVAQRDYKHDVLIAPTEGVKDYDKNPFPALWKHFVEEIGKVDVLLVIGFSYRDEEIVGMIKDRLENGMALISVSLEPAADIKRVSDAKIETVEIDGQTLQTAGKGVVLVKQSFEPNNINMVRALLNAAFKFLREDGRLPVGHH